MVQFFIINEGELFTGEIKYRLTQIQQQQCKLDNVFSYSQGGINLDENQQNFENIKQYVIDVYQNEF